MSDINWASLITNPDKVKSVTDSELIYYHGIVAQNYYNTNTMLPGGYIQAIRRLFLSINEELMNRLRDSRREEIGDNETD